MSLLVRPTTRRREDTEPWQKRDEICRFSRIGRIRRMSHSSLGRAHRGWIRAAAVAAGFGLALARLGGVADAASHPGDSGHWLSLDGFGDGAQFSLPPTTYDGITGFDSKSGKGG